MSRHVLIVDDNPTNLKLAAHVLSIEGYRVSLAIDAEHAQETLNTAMPDVILMDIGLPGMDGLSLTRKIKADARLQHIPVIAMTAFAMKGDDQHALAAGCEGYITKPIDTRRFAQQLEACLKDSGGR